jgi:hypothetical protein
LLKIIKLLNLTETTGTFLVGDPDLIIFKRVYKDFSGIPMGQYAHGRILRVSERAIASPPESVFMELIL